MLRSKTSSWTPRRLQEMLAAERTLGSVEEGDKQRIFAFGQSDLSAGRGR